MARIFLIAAAISIIIVLAFYPTPETSYLKRLFKDFFSPKAWKKVDVVDEKHAFDDFFGGDVPWGMLELVVGGSAACIISLVVGWRLNNYRNMYEKAGNVNLVEESLLQKFNTLEEHIETVERKFIELQEKYTMLNDELSFSRDLLEKEIPVTKDAFQQMETECATKGSQTIRSASYHKVSPDVLPESLDNESLQSIAVVQESPEFDFTSEDKQIDSDKIADVAELKYEVVNNDLFGDLNISTVRDSQHGSEEMSSVSYEKHTCAKYDEQVIPLEIDVVKCESAEDGQLNKVSGCGESRSRRIPQYKQQYPPRVSTPRRYASVPIPVDPVEPAPPQSRRRKPKNTSK